MENTTPPSSPDSSLSPSSQKYSVLFTGGLIAFVIVSMAAGYYFFYHQAPVESQADSEEMITPTSVKEENPVTLFYQNFSTKDYRIKVKRTTAGTHSIASYYQKGKLVRLDMDDTSVSSTIIFKDGKMYNLDHLQKAFMEEDENNPWLSRFMNIYKILSLIDVVVMSETPNASPWKALPPDPNMPHLVGYETLNREVNLRSIEGPVYMGMRIFVDPKTKLIMAISLVANEEQNFEENMAIMEYQEVTDIEILKQFPSDYKKQGLFDSIKLVPQN